MNIYYSLYCRAYDWYNSTGKKSKDTLRISAVALLAGLPCFNILSIAFLISILNKHTLINKWAALFIYVILFVFNLLLITSERSDLLRGKYILLPDGFKKRINSFFYFYLIISILIFMLILCYTAYYKNKYGNYDL